MEDIKNKKELEDMLNQEAMASSLMPGEHEPTDDVMETASNNLPSITEEVPVQTPTPALSEMDNIRSLLERSKSLRPSAYEGDMSDDALRQAQKDANFDRLISRSANNARMLMGVDPSSHFTEQEKMAGQGVDDILQRRKANDSEFERQQKIAAVNEAEEQRNNLTDPTSAISVASREVAKQMKIPNITDKITAAQLDGVLPLQAKLMAARAAEEELALAKRKQALAERELNFKMSPQVAGAEPKEIKLFREKEKIKDESRIRKENRKIIEGADKDLQTWNNLKDTTEKALKLAKAYNKNNLLGSGAYAKFKSQLGSLSPETQALEKELQKLSLDQLTKTFGGMSKAIDTPVERAQFEKTVPGIGLDDPILIDELETRLKAASKAIANIKSKKEKIQDPYIDPNTLQSSNEANDQQQSVYPPGTIIKARGKTYKVSEDGDSLEEVK